MRRPGAGRGAAALVLLALAGCAAPAGSAPPGGSTPPAGTTAALGPVTVIRTGGFAGVQDTLVVQPDGRWQSTRRTAAAGSGQLTAPQRERLRRLAVDPRLAAEATRRPPPTRCRDAFSYTVIVAATTVGYVACSTDPDHPVAAPELVHLLTAATSW